MKCLNAYSVTIIILFSTSLVWALPNCVGTWSETGWSDCFGTYIWEKSGNEYVGEWKNGKRSGQGTYTYASGDKYVGEYQNNKRNGQGTYNWGEGPNKGDKFIGFWKDDWKNGQGTYTFANGAKDVGEYKNSKLNGYAIRYDSDGIIYQEGIFKDGVCQYDANKPSANLNSNSKLNRYKAFCEEIGFKPGTEKFADCVLKAMEED